MASPSAGPPRPLIVEFSDRREGAELPGDWLAQGVAAVLALHGLVAGEVSLAAVSDAEMHQLNRRFLEHDYPTDVLTFPHDGGLDWVTGDVVFSADYAEREAAERGVSPHDEMLLYAIHGALHLAGFTDADPEEKAAMRAAEREAFAALQRPCPVVGDADEEST